MVPNEPASGTVYYPDLNIPCYISWLIFAQNDMGYMVTHFEQPEQLHSESRMIGDAICKGGPFRSSAFTNTD